MASQVMVMIYVHEMKVMFFVNKVLMIISKVMAMIREILLNKMCGKACANSQDSD